MRQSCSRKPAGSARMLMLLAVFSPLFLAFPVRVQAAGAAGATTVRDITLRLEMDGKQVGETKLTAGSRVFVFEDDGTRLKVGRSEAVSGWVNRDDVALDPVVVPGAATAQKAPLSSPAPEPASKSSVVRRPAILSVGLSEEIEKEEKGGQCRRIGVAQLIDVSTAGVDGGGPQGSAVKMYVVLSTEFGVKRREAPKLEVLELKPKADDPAALTYRHFQWDNTCSCCKKMKLDHLVGYYCEIVSAEGEVLAARASDLSKDERSALQQFLGREPGGA